MQEWTEGFNRLGGDLIHAQRIEILRAKVQATSEGMLNEVVLDTPTTLLKMKLLELLYSEEPWIELMILLDYRRPQRFNEYMVQKSMSKFILIY